MPSTNGLNIQWENEWPRVAGMSAEVQLEGSLDLVNWEAVPGANVRGSEIGDLVTALLGADYPFQFFRVVTRPQLEPLAFPGAEVFGYGPAFRQELRRTGYPTTEEFANRYPAPPVLEEISWDPTTAQYWAEFDTDPQVHNATLPSNDPERRRTDFRLNPTEFELFKQNGFVVSERLGAKSFAEIFYRIFIDDLPVFISSDAILQAWHRSYALLLEEVEVSFLSPGLQEILAAMADEIPAMWAQHKNSYNREPILDADFFIAVARSLFAGSLVPSQLQQDERVEEFVTLARRQSGTAYIDLFGSERLIDFSQFKPRGYYERNQLTAQYFQGMIWCGRIDFRIADPERLAPGVIDEASLRELAGSVVLQQLLKSSGKFDLWKQADDIIKVFVGLADSMNFAQLEEILTAAGVTNLSQLNVSENYTDLANLILGGNVGIQDIRGDLYESPFGPRQSRLPRSFTFMGQRFVPDSWAFSQTVYDSILWPGVTGELDKVRRRVPSGLDVAFTIFSNNNATPILASRIQNQSGHPFRDGMPYQHHLIALREVINQLDETAWQSSMYNSWLSALRTLSQPYSQGEVPQAMRTRAWAMKNLNTQLASWTHLRHDTVLYVKQSYTSHVTCSYPYAFVEPVPEFWRTMEQLAIRTRDLLAELPATTRSTNQAGFLDHFATSMRKLHDISEKELDQTELSQEEDLFLKDTIEEMLTYGAGRSYKGWYPRLFYKNIFAPMMDFDSIEGCNKWDAVVTDVHSNPPDESTGDPGSILHQGVGNVNLLMIAINNGPDRMVYAGPVLSHFEFERPWGERMTDTAWKAKIDAKELPPRPEWTAGYLATD